MYFALLTGSLFYLLLQCGVVSALQSKIATSDIPDAAALLPLALFAAKQDSVGESRTTYANVT